jgi:hypothetical protein
VADHPHLAGSDLGHDTRVTPLRGEAPNDEPDRARESGGCENDASSILVGGVRGINLGASPTTFWIFDTFGSEDARQAHINGEIAAALMANPDELLAAPPEILPADVLAAK